MTIDYYGDKDNYIHLKWGDCVKMYNFTTDEPATSYDEIMDYLLEENTFISNN